MVKVLFFLFTFICTSVFAVAEPEERPKCIYRSLADSIGDCKIVGLPDVIDAIGESNYSQLPVLKRDFPLGDYINFRLDDMNASVMRGEDTGGRHFIALKLVDLNNEQICTMTFFQRDVGVGNNWVMATTCKENAIFGMISGRGINKFELGIVAKLIRGETVNVVNGYGGASMKARLFKDGDDNTDL